MCNGDQLPKRRAKKKMSITAASRDALTADHCGRVTESKKRYVGAVLFKHANAFGEIRVAKLGLAFICRTRPALLGGR